MFKESRQRKAVVKSRRYPGTQMAWNGKLRRYIPMRG